MQIELDKKTIVAERLFLIRQLDGIEPHFQGDGFELRHRGESWEHPYQHYHALRIYLLLTCFDILGQPEAWLDFQSWLKSKKTVHIEERANILSRCQSADLIDTISYVSAQYNAIYGVKNSFYKFMREIISPPDRERLLKSIRVSTLAPTLFGDGVVRDALSDYDANDFFKEKFLYNARNSFTHKGIPYGTGAKGVFKDFGEPAAWPGEVELRYFIVPIASEKRDGKVYQFGVVGWPGLLFDIVSNALDAI